MKQGQPLLLTKVERIFLAAGSGKVNLTIMTSLFDYETSSKLINNVQIARLGWCSRACTRLAVIVNFVTELQGGAYHSMAMALKKVSFCYRDAANCDDQKGVRCVLIDHLEAASHVHNKLLPYLGNIENSGRS
jgi:hypothetical protein